MKQKDASTQAEDIAYTINHAMVCAATDIIDPFVAAWSQKHVGKKIHTSWCNKTHDHDHSHGHSHDHHHGHHHGHTCNHHDHAPTFGGALKHWVIGEAIGDIGAVPVAVGFQRYAPGFMDWVSGEMEKVLGKHYMRGAEAAAKQWAQKQGLYEDSAECRQHADEIYRYEVRHFGQAAVWTVASIGLNIASQKYITNNRHPVSYMLLYKTLGAATSAALLLGGRAYVPETFRKWDQWTADNIFTPSTKTIGKLFGVDEQTVDNVVNKEKELTEKKWEERVEQKTEEATPAR
ncbi:MAG: hypothetical protein AB7L92_08305 [Alphaproteobacteria bacterium]